MEGYISDKEQIQLIKDWWKKNGSTIIIAIILVLGINFGWRYWRSYKNNKAEHASMLYEQMLSASLAKKQDDFKLFAQHLIKDYDGTPYATLASLLLAKENIGQSNFTAAEKNLDWVMQHGKNKSFKQIARIRKARLLINENKLQQALDLLKYVDDNAFMAAILETRGNVFAAQGNKKRAVAAYKAALHVAPKDSMIKERLMHEINY